jgi:hypothetical protein
MSAGMDLRKRGIRKDPPKRGKRAYDPSPLSAIDAGTPGEIPISNDTMMALSHLYHTSPSIQAARTILMGQLLSSGCVVRRNGREVQLQDTFARHLRDVWVPFARNVIDHFLQFGFVVVSLEEENPPPFANFLKGKALAATSEMGPEEPHSSAVRKAPDASAARAAKRPIASDTRMDRVATAQKLAGNQGARNLIPHVPDVGQYQLSFCYVGETSYRRQYRIFATNSDSVYRQDFSSEVFFKSPPDAGGNICSPIATVFQSASFISALEELALQAEVVRARQLLVTQPMPKVAGNNNLDPANLFFDSESRAVQASATAEDDAQQASSLATQAKMMQIINRLQTTNAVQQPGGAPGPSAAPAHVPPPMPPQLFAAPDRQQVVPGVKPPEARSDLVDIMRCVNDHIAAAMGVPASVIFEGKFSSNSMSQLQLLNTTVTSIALAVNKVLTACYHTVYDNAQEGDELVLLTAPLASTAEIEQLFTAGVIDIQSALPAALHSLGCTASEVAGAVKRREAAEKDGADTKLMEVQNQTKLGDADVALKGAQTLKTAAETKVVEQQVAKTKAETKKTLHDAAAPHVKPGAAGGGGGGGSSGGSSSSKAKK